MPLPKEEFRVFISHATTEDGELVRWIADALDRLHIRAFVYERYQRGGQNRFEVIKRWIKACPYFLVVLTKDGIASQWVNQEIGEILAKSGCTDVFIGAEALNDEILQVLNKGVTTRDILNSVKALSEYVDVTIGMILFVPGVS